MPQSLMNNQFGAEDGLKKYSCLLCRQRKIKCDRHNPCSNCVKSEKQCSFVPPVRGKRKRTKPHREGLHAKLKRYEDLLRSYGAKIEPSDDFDNSNSETTSQPDIDIEEDGETRSSTQSDPFGIEGTKPKLITKEGTSRYFESALWSSLGDPQHPETTAIDDMDEINAHESALFFEPDHDPRSESLESLHPPFEVVEKLKDIYVDRVDPLIKILHIPTFWTALTNGLQHLQNIPRSLEAAIFAFYLSAITTMNEQECQSSFGIEASLAHSRYRIATRQALENARLLSTSSPMTLQAYSLFMMCVRTTYRCDTLYILSGMAVRLARKMGLHRDGTSLGLSPFETEIRRRLWWHVVHVDFRVADVLGIKPSLDLSSGDAKIPLNIQDEDLHPDMISLPSESCGITSITLCLIRCEIMEFLRKFSTSSPGDVRWELLYSSAFTLAKKDSAITQIEDYWEKKYLRYCDPCNSLHILVSIVTRSSICKMKLFTRDLRQFVNCSVQVPDSERNVLFENAVKLLEYGNMMKGGSHGLDKYKWQLGTSYIWNTMLCVLIEARHRKTGPEMGKFWELIGIVFSHYPKVLEQPSGGVYTALGKWTLDVWEGYVEATKEKGLPEPSTPGYIHALRRGRKVATEASVRSKDMITSRPGTRGSFSYDRFQPQRYEGGFDFGQFETYEFPDLHSFETDPSEWIQWEQLVTEQSGFI
ncbi:putative C6 transcription factor [Hypoxylon trugodes]|uniref:putative C6 transcription factor n=1 Tax=Hypoxylon trugodes TaxID=326681 RepID=UPI0021993EBB|nr:putative C6 transcription factor [Hypoxylon trugodes]KAI1388153.1 putative C6 transcription factor [Hypoxylon trugodes]